MLFRSGSLRRLQQSHSWEARVLRESFGGADPSCVQDQTVTSSRSNRGTTPWRKEPVSQHPSTDFGRVASCGKARVACCSSRVRRLLWNMLGRRILPECKSEVPSGCPAPRRAAAFRRESKNAANSLACLKPFFRSCYEHVLSVATARQWTGQPLLEEVVSIRVAHSNRPKPTLCLLQDRLLFRMSIQS